MNRIRITDESLNSYGFWVKTSGGDLSVFEKNPVLLYDHDRYSRLPIGILTDLKVEANGDITGVPEFDMDDDFAASIARKYEKKHIRSASIGFRVLEFSEDKTMLKQGQTRATVTKWQLKEVSLTPLPSNTNAVQLYDDEGNVVQLSDGNAQSILPEINLSSSIQNPIIPQTMELKQIATLLKLSDSASPADIANAVSALQNELAAAQSSLKALKDAEVAALSAQAEAEVTAALTDGRLTADKADNWRKLFAADHATALTAIKDLPVAPKLKDFADGKSKSLNHNGKTYEELERENPTELRRLKDQDPETFKALYANSSYAAKK